MGHFSFIYFAHPKRACVVVSDLICSASGGCILQVELLRLVKGPVASDHTPGIVELTS